jgi:uncharacterized BrkB/YihY/UPF0761 family membrane protein
MGAVDGWQRNHRPVAIAYGVVKKFGDDNARLYVVSLGWYGFVGIYPLLLALVTVFAFIGVGSLGHQLTSTLHQFPVVGTQFNPAHGSSRLHGSALGLIIGVVGLVYGAQGVTQTIQQTMVQVWSVPPAAVPGFLKRLIRSLTGLAIIGSSFLVSAALTTFATSNGVDSWLRVLVLVALALINAFLYLGAFRALTPSVISARVLVPGSVLAGIAFTLLITVGSGLVQHQLKSSSETYGQFGVVIGLVAFLFLLATISLYGAELNPVLTDKLWPRALQSSHPTEVDDRVLRDKARQTLDQLNGQAKLDLGSSGEADVDVPHTEDRPAMSPGS